MNTKAPTHVNYKSITILKSQNSLIQSRLKGYQPLSLFFTLKAKSFCYGKRLQKAPIDLTAKSSLDTRPCSPKPLIH